MIKKLGIVVLLMLSLNFLAVAGGVGYLFGTGKLDKEKAKAIAKIAFPDPPPPATQPTTQPAKDDVVLEPLIRIDELLAKQTGKTAAEQATIVRDAFDSLGAQLDRQRRELIDKGRQVELAQLELNQDRAAVETRELAMTKREQERATLEQDEGFKKTLEIYDSMATKQIKDLFATMDDATVVRYLQAMEPRRVSRIVKEFTSPEELVRAQSLMERMRKNDGSAPQDATAASANSPAVVP